MLLIGKPPPDHDFTDVFMYGPNVYAVRYDIITGEFHISWRYGEGVWYNTDASLPEEIRRAAIAWGRDDITSMPVWEFLDRMFSENYGR